MRNKLTLLIAVLLIALCAVSAMAAIRTASGVYSISAEGMDPIIGSLSSSSYTAMGIGGGIVAGSAGNTSYGLASGYALTIFPSLAVLITTVAPNSGYNTGTLAITVTGGGFNTGATVSLQKAGATAEVVATEVNVLSTSTITGTLNLTGALTGAWNLVVKNSDGLTGTLASAFNVKTWVAMGQLLNYPNPFNPLNGPATIIYQLAVNADTSLLIFNISHELVYKADFVSGTNGGRAGDNTITWDGYSGFGELSSNTVYFARLIDKSSGRILAKGKIAVLK